MNPLRIQQCVKDRDSRTWDNSRRRQFGEPSLGSLSDSITARNPFHRPPGPELGITADGCQLGPFWAGKAPPPSPIGRCVDSRQSRPLALPRLSLSSAVKGPFTTDNVTYVLETILSHELGRPASYRIGFPGTQEPKGTAREVARSAWERRCSGPDRVVSKWICGIWADFDQAAGLRSRRYEF